MSENLALVIVLQYAILHDAKSGAAKSDCMCVCNHAPCSASLAWMVGSVLYRLCYKMVSVTGTQLPSNSSCIFFPQTWYSRARSAGARRTMNMLLQVLLVGQHWLTHRDGRT